MSEKRFSMNEDFMINLNENGLHRQDSNPGYPIHMLNVQKCADLTIKS
jgi:hypothetical protein